MFPCKRHPTSAIFFANLMKELAPNVSELIVLTPRVYLPKFLAKIKKRWEKWFLDPMVSKENGMEIIRPYILYLRGVKYVGINSILMQYFLFNLVRKLITKRNIDIILGYNMLPDGVAAVRLAKMFKLPVGFWAIGSDVNDLANRSKINYYLSRKCIEDSNIVLTESKDLENSIKTFSKKPIRVETFYKGINVSNFQNLMTKSDLFEKLRLDSGKRYMLFVGRLIYDKGIYEIAKTFKVIAKQYPDFDLILIGEEIEKEKLIAEFGNSELLNRVLFKGIIPHEEVADYMKISNLLVFPSWAEGLPNVVMEAMAIGLPVVSSDVGGIPEVLKDGVTGLSVPPKNVEKLTEAVTRMIEDSDLREKCINNAKQLIGNEFDVKKNVKKLYEILLDVKNSYL